MGMIREDSRSTQASQRGLRRHLDEIVHGDCEDVLKEVPEDSIDLIVTSPPYADQRKKSYGGIRPDDYVEWFLPKADHFFRVLKPEGTFILNIKEPAVNGERHTYVIELILEMRRRGWLWTEEFMWHKKNSYPGKWPNRFRNNWERLLQFNKQKQFKMLQEAVMAPVGGWAKNRLANLSDTDKVRDESRAGSGFGKRVANWIDREMVYPTNVLHLATESSNKQHSAVFPVALPRWFIKLFTEPGDIVLDPFIGSGSTAVAAVELGRHYLGIDINREFTELSNRRVKKTQMRVPSLAERRSTYYGDNGCQ